MTVEISEGERQVIILAIARLSVERPGWHPACLKPIAEKLSGPDLYEEFRTLKIMEGGTQT
jgi:hypothetical protein